MKEDSDDKYSIMNENNHHHGKIMTNRGSETKANDVECHKTQEDQNQRRAFVTGFHNDTTEQKVQDMLKETFITIGM